MIKTLETIIKASKTAMLVAFYNKFSEKRVTKFADRKTAEGRLLQLATNRNMTPETFVGAMGEFADQTEINALKALLPAKEESKLANKPAVAVITDKASDKAIKALESNPAPEVKEPKAPKAKKATAEADGEPRKQNTPPHLNLRCPHCGYYAKTTPGCLAKARLTCPVDPKHGILLTAEERNERRGR